MKNLKYFLRFNVIFLILIFTSTSCEDYLDKAPEASITEKDVYTDFTSYQGFVEEMYNCIMDPDKGGAWNKYLFADETLNNYPYQFDLGNYWGNEGYFYGKPNINTSSLEGRNRRVWEWAWYAIRKANLALEKLEGTEEEPSLFEGTQEEHDLIKGQALFFRAWFYFEISRYWGGMPYITRVLSPTESLVTEEFNRLTYQETAIKMAEDFRAAADLLPNHWDETEVGQETSGDNDQRVNKFFALGYLGKALLYGASPMPNEEANGSNTFNAELAQQAADAFGELLALADETGTYQLQPWDEYMLNFFHPNRQHPGGDEVIMRPTIYNHTRIRWSAIGATVPSSFALNSGSNADVPTHNITKNYGMENGLPIDDPDSGYDPEDPWESRDPRFYKVIAKDGDQIHRDKDGDKFAELYNGGRHRSQINPPSVTGYYSRKFNNIGPDFNTSMAGNVSAYVPYLRMADVYLMYAEAVLFSSNGGTPQSSASNYSMTAEDAINAVRNRAQLPNIDADYTASQEVFFEEIVRERAVELIFEGARFCDLRRWNRNDDPRYLEKTAINFDRGSDGKPTNIEEEVIVTRVADKKHNWLPIQVGYTKLYEGFPQNPGW